MINKHDVRQAELVNLQGKKMENMVGLENSKDFNEHSIHVRKEYKEAKKVKGECALQNIKDQEDLEIHQLMLECYSINLYKISMNKELKKTAENK